MQRNTLLEPNNFIPAWETGEVEKHEVSVTLKSLRLQYDRIHRTVQAKQLFLDDLKRELEKKGEEEITLSDSNALKASTTQGNQSELDALIEEHDFQKMTTESYQYMLKRMKADLISSQLKS